MSPLTHAQALLARGFSPIPVPQGEKACRITAWQNLRLTAADLPLHFGDQPLNIGVLLGEPSGWLVDVDLDHPLAVTRAATLLPPTAMKWGRASKPRSHWTYRVAGPVDTRKWKSGAHGMIVELRSTGCQTLAPGSTHPSGESVRWDEDGAPATIDPDELIALLARLAETVRRELGDDPDGSSAPFPKPHSPTPGFIPGSLTSREAAYGRAALDREVAKVAAASEGSRNDTLVGSAFSLGTLVGGGILDGDEVSRALFTAAKTCGLPDAEATATVASGLEAGKKRPRGVPEVSSQPPTRNCGGGICGGGGVAEGTTPDVDICGGGGAPPIASATGGNDGGSSENPVPQYVPFPVELLPGIFGELVRQGAKVNGCEAAYIALPLLAGAAGAIGSSQNIRLHSSWSEPCVFWSAVIAESGSVKGPCLDLAVAPYRARERELSAKNDLAGEKYKLALAEHQKKAKSAASGPPPEVPPYSSFIVTDATSEGMCVSMRNNPHGLLGVFDELSLLFGLFGRYGDGKLGGSVDSARWIATHDGRDFPVTRSAKGGSFLVKAPRVSIASGVQPSVFIKAIAGLHVENGLASRFALGMPPYQEYEFTTEGVPEHVVMAYSAAAGRLLALPPNTDAPAECSLTPDSKAIFGAWVKELNSLSRGRIGAIRYALAKLRGGAARLALLTHFMRYAAQANLPSHLGQIDAESMTAGVALARWFALEAIRAYRVLFGEKPEEADRRRLVEWIAKKAGGVTVRDVTHSLNRYKGKTEAARADLNSLVEAGVGHWAFDDHNGGRGAPTDRFRLGRATPTTTSAVLQAEESICGGGQVDVLPPPDPPPDAPGVAGSP